MSTGTEKKKARFPIVIAFVLLLGAVSLLKNAVLEPFPKLEQRIISDSADQEYDKVLEEVHKVREHYPERYWETQLGYFHAKALAAKDKPQESLNQIEEYIKKTTHELYSETLRLQADDLLTLGRTQDALVILVKLYQAAPLRNLNFLDEMAQLDANFDPKAYLDPKTEQLAYDVVAAYQQNHGKHKNWDGWVQLPQKSPVHLSQSLYFQVKQVQVVPQGQESKVTGVIESKIKLKNLGVRVQGRNAKNLFLDEQDCMIGVVQKNQGKPFTCMLQDPGPIKRVQFSEVKYEH